jgi:formylglycine-generating enzyme required for sulfatase activity
MKKSYLKTFALAACMLLGLSATAQVQGDINGDNKVDIADVNAVINMMLGKSAQTAAGDINGDGSVDIADVNAVINLMLGKTNQEVQTYTVNGVTFKMVAVEGGTFTMGATAEQGSDAGNAELPTHQVTLSSYSIGQTEVTQELWQAVMGSNPSHYKGNLKRPVEEVSWEDCQIFLTKLKEMTGQNFRLPTEAEWEFAARGGNKSQTYKYAGSNNIDEVAWYADNSSATTHPVASKTPNELGLFDMSGNVLEWCQDVYYFYSSEAQTNPTGPSLEDIGKVVRGGDYFNNATFCRVSFRLSGNKSTSFKNLGLRLAL